MFSGKIGEAFFSIILYEYVHDSVVSSFKMYEYVPGMGPRGGGTLIC